MIRSESAFLPAAGSTSLVPRFQLQVVKDKDGTTRTVDRPPIPESASSGPCNLFYVTPIQPPSSKEGYDAFDRLAAEVARDDQAVEEVRQGRKWIAASYGSGDLASLRLAAGLSQSELAVRCGIEQPHVSRYESGRHEPLVTIASKMASALGTSLEVLVKAWNQSRINSQWGKR